MSRLNIVRWCIVPFLVLIFAGCGGGGGSSTPTVSGVAAAGSTLVGTVYLKDASVPAKELFAPLAADGSFRFNLNGLKPPYILKATGTANHTAWTLYSFTPGGGIANINPLSSLALAVANNSDDLESLYNAPDSEALRAIGNALANAISGVQTALRPTLEKFGAADVNFITDPYVANHHGLDLLLDLVSISTANGVVTLLDMTAKHGEQSSLSEFTAGTYDFIAAPVTTPGTVGVIPGVASLQTGGSIYFSAFVIGSQRGDFSWSVVESDGGTVTSDGFYTAPGKAGSYHVTATSMADPAKSRTVLVVVKAPENILTITTSGPGEFTVMGDNLVGVSGAEIEISYDPTTLANPRISPGALTASTMFIGNDHFKPNGVKIAFMTLSPISGSGPLATLKFDLPGPAPGTVVITRKVISVYNPPTPFTGPAGGTSGTGSGSPVPATTPSPGGSGSVSSGGN